MMNATSPTPIISDEAVRAVMTAAGQLGYEIIRRRPIWEKRGPGRPATFSTNILTALRPELLADLDAWRAQQPDGPSRRK